MNAPALVLVGAFGIYPLVFSFWLSLHQYNLKQPDRFQFVGLGNYLQLLRDPGFSNSLKVTVVVVLSTLVITLFLGLLLALLLNTAFRGRGLLRAAILVPWAIPPIVNAMMWKLAYNSQFGVLNGALNDIGILHKYVAWLSHPALAVTALISAHVWNTVPLAALPLLAGLQAIPGELYEAAQVDGATTLRRFRHITLPYLAGPILVVLLLVTMVSFKVFDLVYTLTFGGPGATTSVLAWQAYKISFSSLDIGYGSAWSNTLALFIGVMSVAYIAFLYRAQPDA